MQRLNPWLQLAADRSSPAEPVNVAIENKVSKQLPQQAPQTAKMGDEDVVAAPATGPTAPQPFVEPPVRGLPIRAVTETAALWWVGTHGGAGESTLAALDDQWRTAGHSWPKPIAPGTAARCVVVARTHAPGLLAAQRALQQWAASAAGVSVQLLGLVLVADAPGRLPVVLRDLAKVVGGGAPRVWEVPWVEAWRFGAPQENTPRAVAKIVKQINITLAELPAL